ATIIFIVSVILFFIEIKYIYEIKNFKIRYLIGISANVSLFIAGFLLTEINKSKDFKYYDNFIVCKAVISEPVTLKSNYYKSTLENIIYKTDSNIILEKSRAIVYFSGNNKPEYGDEIIFKGSFGKIKNPGNPHEFNYKKYLSEKGITAQIFLKEKDYKLISKHQTGIISRFAEASREYAERIYKKYGIEGKELSVLQALTLGDKSELKDDTKKSYASSGAMHILAVSGLHVGIIYMIFNFLLGFLDKVKFKTSNTGKIIKAVLLIFAVWGFAVISGLSPSIRRAALMFSFIIAGKALKYKINVYNSVSASAFVLLAVNPFLITDAGFQLSYAAITGIIFFHPEIVSLFTVKNRVLYYIWSLTAVSAAAQITTFPLSLYYFHIFPVLFFLSNLIIIPAATLILVTSLLLILSSFLPVIPDIFAVLLKFFLKVMNLSVFSIKEIPFSVIKDISFHGSDLLFAYLSIILFSAFILTKKAKTVKLLLITVILWTGTGIYQKIMRKRNYGVTVYNIKNEIAVDFIGGGENYFIGNKPARKIKHFEYGIKPNRRYINERDFKFIPADTPYYRSKTLYKNGCFTAFGNKTFLMTTKDSLMLPEGLTEVDYIIFSGNANITPKEIKDRINFKKIIFDSSNTYSELQYLKSTCRKNNIDFYVVSEQGAFIATF
ncbi:MAG: ComEC family competence protein, partial [Chlorobi bacterium]|nr:ComEC family competence protein [Chlorobiota bacterium]